MRATLLRTPGKALEERRLDFVCQPILDPTGAVESIFVEGVDVTAKHAATDALRVSEARNRQILDSAIDYAIIAFDAHQKVTRWNVGAERILGWTEAEMLGCCAARIFTPEDRAAGVVELAVECVPPRFRLRAGKPCLSPCTVHLRRRTNALAGVLVPIN